MPERLPPLNALRAFEASARHLSLAGAASELNVTPAAISLQIKTLEDYLGVKVFHRHPRGLELTEEAMRCLPSLQRGFSLLRESTKILRASNRQNTLELWTAPAFASKWLMPRLNHYTRSHPDVDMNIHASDDMIEKQSGSAHAARLIRQRQIDVAITFTNTQHTHCQSDKLFDVSAVPLCSPTLRAGSTPLLTPQDLRYQHLLHDDTNYDGNNSWKEWLSEAQVEGVSWERGTHFNQVQLALEAAAERQGVLLSLDLMAQRDITAGRLCIPFGPAVPLEKSYYLLRPLHHQNDAIDSFCDWLLDQAKLSQEATLRISGD